MYPIQNINKRERMEADFWHDLWMKNETGWHLNDANPLLLEHFPILELKQNSKIFVPLCGKTHDIQWLLAEGFEVVGVELHENAIIALFETLKLKPSVTTNTTFKLYQADNITIYVGDFFDLQASDLGKIDAIYDRAAIVALPSEMRKRYTARLLELTKQAPQIVITFQYDQDLKKGPPFSVEDSLLKEYYQNHYDLKPLKTIHPKAGSPIEIYEKIWLLEPKQ